MDNNDLLFLVIGGTILILSLILAIVFLANASNIKENRRRQEAETIQKEEKEKVIYEIASELHDNITQDLNFVKGVFYTVLKECQSESRPKMQVAFDKLEEKIEDLRRMAHALNADYLMHTRLVPALRDKVHHINMGENLKAKLEVDGEVKSLPPKLELSIYRISQEAIGNTIVHAKAKNLTINISFQLNDFKMTITDDGIGFNQNKKKTKGLGLTNMERRAQQMNAALEMVSKIGKGTQLTLFIPNAVKSNAANQHVYNQSKQIIHE